MEKNDKIKTFIQHILQECEEEGLSIWEVEKLPQALKFAIEDSVIKQTQNVSFSSQIPTALESCCSDGNSCL